MNVVFLNLCASTAWGGPMARAIDPANAPVTGNTGQTPPPFHVTAIIGRAACPRSPAEKLHMYKWDFREGGRPIEGGKKKTPQIWFWGRESRAKLSRIRFRQI
ncbi:MAG: hypothetical protein CM15mP21_1240 [Hyphomicrobiales bacterium]|nr:MAG: hypothetical protein CM15mP21_1240 [Hyphomicrobiales bacterium]